MTVIEILVRSISITIFNFDFICKTAIPYFQICFPGKENCRPGRETETDLSAMLGQRQQAGSLGNGGRKHLRSQLVNFRDRRKHHLSGFSSSPFIVF
jgi:hypothetical protein